jgi:hypothetical protein
MPRRPANSKQQQQQQQLCIVLNFLNLPVVTFCSFFSRRYARQVDEERATRAQELAEMRTLVQTKEQMSARLDKRGQGGPGAGRGRGDEDESDDDADPERARGCV